MWINFLEMRFAVDNSMIFFDRVTKIYGNGQKALDNVSLKVGRGNLCFWRRDSGAGKTTMLELILKETDPSLRGIYRSMGLSWQASENVRFTSTAVI